MVCSDIDHIDQGWRGLRQVVGIRRTVIGKGYHREDMSYYISSMCSNALMYATGIRNHWSIENTLHWVKDVTLREDASKIRKGNAPQNISLLRDIAIDLFRSNGYKSIVQAVRLTANDIKKMIKMME